MILWLFCLLTYQACFSGACEGVGEYVCSSPTSFNPSKNQTQISTLTFTVTKPEQNNQRRVKVRVFHTEGNPSAILSIDKSNSESSRYVNLLCNLQVRSSFSIFVQHASQCSCTM